MPDGFDADPSLDVRSVFMDLSKVFDMTGSSHRRCSVRKGVFRNLTKLTRKHLHQSLFLNKVAGLILLTTVYFTDQDWISKIVYYSIFLFLKYLPKFIRPVEKKTYNINDSVGIKLLSRLRLNFSHLRELKFRRNFKDTSSPLWSGSIGSQTRAYFL